MTAEKTDATHDAPVWRQRADFVIGARLAEPGRTEQLWARQLGADTFEICCIPFFVYDVSLGDIVKTDARYDFVRVIEPSGRLVFRVWFGETFVPRQGVAEDLVGMGALLEWSSANLLAVDAANSSTARELADYLEDQEQQGNLQYETGRS